MFSDKQKKIICLIVAIAMIVPIAIGAAALVAAAI